MSDLTSSPPLSDPPPVSQPLPKGPSTRPLLDHSRRSSDTHQRAASLHTVRGFTPESVTPSANHSPPTSHRSSGLSASLASSSFHHPNNIQQSTSPPNSDANDFEFTHRVDAQSRPGATVLEFNRKTDDGLDMATSYRFFLVEEQMKKRKQEATAVANPSSAPTATLNLSPVNNGTSKLADPVVTKQQASADTAEKQLPTSPAGKSFKKKNVTFDVKPAVVTITREVEAEKAAEAAQNLTSQDMVFDLEEDDPGYASGEPSLPPFQREPIVAPRNNRASHKLDNSGLSASYQAVRPLSLPTPSAFANYRPTLPQVSSPLTKPPNEPSQTQTSSEPSKKSSPVSAERVHDPRNSQILKLVAADVPSHRGRWQPGSREWDAFVKRPDNRENDAEDDDLGLGTLPSRQPSRSTSEHEVEPTFVGSLPVPIKLHRPPKEELSLASYQPKATLDGASATSVPTISHRRMSSSAIRKATYAERDKSRSYDPGALDFAGDNDSDDTADEGDARPDHADKASRLALKILHARNSVPEAGVWRSLA